MSGYQDDGSGMCVCGCGCSVETLANGWVLINGSNDAHMRHYSAYMRAERRAADCPVKQVA